jgi:[acyl-carrier-protein] S-malonyltransferase
LMAVSHRGIRVLEGRSGLDLKRDAKFVAGHSLGEYSALGGRGAVSVGDAARLLRTRGLSMQKAVPVGEGAMAALLGLSFEDAAAAARGRRDGPVCQVANDNGAGQVVISGPQGGGPSAAARSPRPKAPSAR